MVKLVVKVVLFIALLWGVNHAASYFVPYFWGNDGWAAKYKYFQKNADQYNVLFFGSSQTYRQIDPGVFDNQLERLGVKSYNFGYEATATPEVNYLYENLLDDKSVNLSKVNVVFMDLQPVRFLRSRNASSMRGRYHMSPANYAKALNLVINSHSSYSNRYNSVLNYTRAFFDNQFNVRSFKDMTKFRQRYGQARKGFMKPLGENDNGFLPLNKDPQAKKRRNEFLNCEKWYIPYSEEMAIYSQDCGLIKGAPFDRELFFECRRLINLSKRKGIHLVFLIPPRSPYLNTTKVAEKLGEEHFISLVDPRKYPKFYKMNHCFDRGHLNQRGARAYTIALAKEARDVVIAANASRD